MDAPWVTTPAAAPALAFAAAGGDPLALSAALGSRFGLDADQRAAVLTQTDLRARAARRWGATNAAPYSPSPMAPSATGTHADGAIGRLNIDLDPSTMFFTRDGLEQASRPAVAAWRAHRIAAAGVRTIADLGCGLGLESRAFAAAGMSVTAVELDADVAAFAAANLRGLDADVIVDDITTMRLPDCDAYFLDPARRDPHAPRSIDGLSGQRVADPEDWSPRWSWVCTLDKPRMVAKVAPGIARERIPDNASATWVQCDGDLVEASIWFNELRSNARRTSTAIVDGAVVDELSSNDAERTDVGVLDGYLYDVNGVVTRAGLVTQLAARLAAHRIDERLGFLTSATLTPTAFATAYSVVESMPFESKRVLTALQRLDAGNITIVKRAFAADTEHLRTQWMRKLSGGRSYTVMLTRIGDQPLAVIAELTESRL